MDSSPFVCLQETQESLYDEGQCRFVYMKERRGEKEGERGKEGGPSLRPRVHMRPKLAALLHQPAVRLAWMLHWLQNHTSEPQMKCRTGTTACYINGASTPPSLPQPPPSLLDCLWLGSSSQGCGLMLLLLFFVLRTGVPAKTYSCYNNKTWRAPALLYTGLYWYRGAPTMMSVDNQQPIC